MEMLVAFRGTNPYTTGLMRSLATSVPLNRERSNASCPGSGRLNGGFSLTEKTLTVEQVVDPLTANPVSVVFHNPNIMQTTFTFTNTSGAAVTGISAFMSNGSNRFSVPPTACNGVINNTAQCMATVTLTPPALGIDQVRITNAFPTTLGQAWVYP
jgi:hypothetical protein